jgi:hypothetical protein
LLQGGFPISSLNTRRNIPVYLKHARILWPLAGLYFGYTWYLLRQNSLEFTQGNVRASRHAHDFEPFAAASRVLKLYVGAVFSLLLLRVCM